MDKSLLSIFEQKIQTNIIEFCKNLNKTEADLYIVMARKAACLVSVLEKLSLLSLRGEVISERVIDCRIEWKALQKVIIIDDVVISGTTLYSTIEFIKEKNPNVEIQLYVLGVNDKWYNDDVLENDGVSYIQTPIRRLNNSECIKLSGDIVRLLSMYPVPYNIDFPIYNTLKLSEEDLHSVLSIPGWYVSKVTAFSQKANEVFTHTFIPNNYILDSCTPSLSCDFLSKSLLKIRTYGRSRLDKQKIFYHITIVPMLIMPPISEDELNKLFFMIVGNNNDDIVSYLNTPTSKLRLVQFILADVLARRFLQEINYILGNSTAVSREFSSLRYLFPPILIKGIVKLAETFSTPLPSVHLAKVQTHIKPARKIDSLWDVNYNLFKPFIDFYYNDEIPSRQLVKEKGKKVFGNREYQKIIDRLKRGYSLTNLLDMLPNIKNDKKILLLSSFLDNYIDEGVVVPITVHEKNLIFRAFRHGEDVQFSQQEERLCYDMLNAFYDELSKKREDNDKSNRNDMQKLWVEKMLVLLLQLGEGRVFESLQTDISQYSHIKRVEKTDIASVRYYLQGPVIVKTPERNIIGQPYLEYTDKANWLTSIFKQDDKSPLVESPNGMYSFNKDAYVKLSQDESCQIVVDAKKTSFANKVGRIFGYLLRNHARGIKPSLSGDELVTLTSSLESKNVMGAMAAEINIFKNGFRDSSENSISNILSLMCDHSLDIDQGFSMIRKKTSYQALNDGCRKYLWYNNSVGYDIIKEISLNFEDEVYRIEWDDFWSPNLEKYGNDESPIIKELVQKEGYWLLCVTVYLYLLEYLLQKERDNNYQNAELIKQIKDIYDKIKSVGHHKLVSEIMPIILEFNAKHHQDSYVKKVFQ